MDVLSTTEYTPLLESLAITVMEPVSTLFCQVVNPSIFGIVSPSVKHRELPLQVIHDASFGGSRSSRLTCTNMAHSLVP